MSKLDIGYKSGANIEIDVSDDYTIDEFMSWLDTIGAYGVWKFNDNTWITKEGIAYITIKQNERKQLLNE